MKKRNNIKLQILKIFFQIAVICIATFLYNFFHSFFTLAILLTVIILPACSVAAALVMKAQVSADIITYQKSAVCDEKIEYKLILKNSGWGLSLNCQLICTIENTFYKNIEKNDNSELKISMPITIHGSESVSIPVTSKYTGNIRFTVTDIYYDDICGLITVHKNVQSDADTIVYPKAYDMDSEECLAYMDGVSETEESTKKGNDFSEVTDIREYQPGDRLKDIHWKLSAKKDILMVKERESVSQSRILLVPNLAGGKERVENVISMTYNLTRAFISENTSVGILIWNGERYEWMEFNIYDKESVMDVFSQIFGMSCYGEEIDIINLVKNFYPHLQSFVIIDERDGEVSGEIVYQ